MRPHVRFARGRVGVGGACGQALPARLAGTREVAGMGRRPPRWVSRLLVEAMHLDQLRTHGGLPGLRDEGASESALARPRNKLANGRRVDLAVLAAAYAYGLARNHPFADGNKRIAFLTAVVFLGLNGWDFEAPDAEVVAHMVALADGRVTEAKCAAWFRAGMRRLPKDAA